MKTSLSILRAMLFALTMFMWGNVSSAQSVRDHVSVSKAPPWIDFQQVPTAKFDLANENTKIYRLVDWQIKIGKGSKTKYKHYATTLLSAESVQDNSTVEVTFDPSFQSVVLHDITVIRDGKRLNRLDLGAFKLFSVETDEDRLIYNGRLRASLIIPDVRVGDTIDYAYSVSGANPAFGPHFSYYAQVQYGVPVQRMHERILVDNAVSVETKIYNDALKPVIRKTGNHTSYVWGIDNLAKKQADDSQPNWYYGFPAYRFSSYKNWDEVGQYFSQYYTVPRRLPRELHSVVTAIKNTHIGKKKRARAALAYVQKEIRYLGIEIGSGGYIPRAPSLTLKRRFGDCKDMTLLLLTLLKELNIEAAPILVNSDTRGGITNELARASAFDHVLVRANINGKSYYLDATRGEQLGDIDHYEQGWYDKGLVVAKDSRGLVNVDIEGPEWWKVIDDTYDLVSDPDKVFLTTKSSYYGFQSDSMYSWYKREGKDGVEKAFLEFFQNTFPEIEQVKPFEIEVVKNGAEVRFTGHYEIPKAWEEHAERKVKTFTAYASDLNSDFPEFVGAKRTTPYKYTHPIRTKQILSFKLDDTWALDDEDVVVTNNTFDFGKRSVFKDNVYTQTYTYKTKSDHIEPSEYASIMAEIKKIDGDLGVELQYGTGTLGVFSTIDFEGTFVGLLVLAALIALFIALVVVKDDEELRGGLILYPVSMKKFLLMSFVSLGIYQYYWIYKNWVWLKIVGEEEVSPAWRTIFAPIMNFSLVGHISQHDRTGYTWFLVLSIPIALTYFLFNILDRAISRVDTLPDWLSILSMFSVLVLVPVAMQVNKMNEDREDLIEQNSKYTWHTYGFIAMFAPIFLVAIYGMYIIITEFPIFTP